MYDNNTQVIIDALVAQIKNLKLTILLKDSEIEQLKAKLGDGKTTEVANG